MEGAAFAEVFFHEDRRRVAFELVLVVSFAEKIFDVWILFKILEGPRDILFVIRDKLKFSFWDQAIDHLLSELRIHEAAMVMAAFGPRVRKINKYFGDRFFLKTFGESQVGIVADDTNIGKARAIDFG